jgi:hypothetical protein
MHTKFDVQSLGFEVSVQGRGTCKRITGLEQWVAIAEGACAGKFSRRLVRSWELRVRHRHCICRVPGTVNAEPIGVNGGALAQVCVGSARTILQQARRACPDGGWAAERVIGPYVSHKSAAQYVDYFFCRSCTLQGRHLH